MAAFDRVLDGVKQVLLVAEEIKRLSESVKTLGVELRDVDRRVARLEGILVGQAQAARMTPKRIEGSG
ncbi:MAG TPA: hypothetical protein VFI50_01635 [Casimicrobiaceae bacterium]|jgi:vacuolar-type H+-ATPase subunit D/Vma8|nr:hypothetical protein [Casimicrobiaceae bacterium]